jgi:hypothetical protein
MKIQFETSKEITIVKEKKQTLDGITIREIMDNPEMKTVVAFTNEVGVITLWKGAEYDTIGQWTDTDVANKIKSLF